MTSQILYVTGKTGDGKSRADVSALGTLDADLMARHTPSPITISPDHRIAWGGLDFDTGELDTEILRVLSVIAPSAGSLRALKVTATIQKALAALDDDCGADGETRTSKTVAGQMAVCLDRLDKARVHLWEAHEALRAAEAMIVNKTPTRSQTGDDHG